VAILLLHLRVLHLLRNKVSFWSAVLAALALVLIFEGLMPLISPQKWRELFSQLLKLQDGQIRFFGLATVILGLFLLAWLF
jgi:uncharacterized protein YjeT (DUF2065 family)